MSQQTIRQQARRRAREVAERRRTARAEKERRMTNLAEQVMVAVGERNRAVAAAEARVGVAIREWTEVEGLTLAELVEWCDETLTTREATRLRRLGEVTDDVAGVTVDAPDFGPLAAKVGAEMAEQEAIATSGESGGAGGGTASG